MSSGSTCPSGWTTATQAQGRLILGVTNGNNIGGSVGTALAGATAPVHQHKYQTSVSIGSRHISASHCCNDQGAGNGSYTVPDNAPGSTDNDSSNLPLIQLVVCQKQ